MLQNRRRTATVPPKKGKGSYNRKKVPLIEMDKQSSKL